MRNRLMGMRILLIVALASSAVAFAQNGQQGTQRGNTGTASSKPFNPHDLSGFWDITNIGLPAGALNSTSNNRPRMTPSGLETFRKTKTGDATALSNGSSPNEKEWNDPIRWCDPTGFPRIMWNPTPAGMRFAHTNEEVIQFFQNDRVWRDIWTDGRKPIDNPEPTYYGYSVGRWDGDTFVVDSNGFTDRTWTDPLGSPHSDQMTLHEVFRRVDHDHLELIITLTDPKTYTKPWVSDKMLFDWAPKSPRSENEELREDFCIYSDQTYFFKNVDPVGASDAPVKNKDQ